MRLTATDLYLLYQPSGCELRIWLKGRGELQAEPTEYEKILQELGARHERQHLESLGEFTDLREGSLEERDAKTLEAIKRGDPLLYQPVFAASHTIDGEHCQLLKSSA
jgi:hypothetical protein